MKRHRPEFMVTGEVFCKDCPFADEDGVAEPSCAGSVGKIPGCPTAATYAAAVVLAYHLKGGE